MRKLMTLVLFLVATIIVAQEKENEDGYHFQTVKEIPITSIKNQNNSGTCWAYSSLGFFEAELLRQGKGEYDLCEMFLAHKTYEDRARASVRLHGDISFSQGGSFYDAIYCMKNYGMMPEDAMPLPGTLCGDTLANFSELFSLAEPYVAAIAKSESKKLSPAWMNGFIGILDSYIGKVPETFIYKGKTYTPQSFQESLGLNMDDYVSLTSYNHHPFYSKFILEIQDNWRWSESYNLPIDELMEVMDNAINNGYTFAWGSDVTESGFTRTGLAVFPNTEDKATDLTGNDMAHWFGLSTYEKQREAYTKPCPEKEYTQEERQRDYDNWTTTDDHGMLIYGIAKDVNGKEYFMVKNSWGKSGNYNGIWYASKPFVRNKTMNIVVHKDAIPKDIKKKLGIK